jgi:hypothetical protein
MPFFPNFVGSPESLCFIPFLEKMLQEEKEFINETIYQWEKEAQTHFIIIYA